MRFLPLGVYLLTTGAFIVGNSASYLASQSPLAKLAPIAGGLMTLAGYLCCRPALKVARGEITAEQLPGLWATWGPRRWRRKV